MVEGPTGIKMNERKKRKNADKKDKKIENINILCLPTSKTHLVSLQRLNKFFF